MYITDGIKYIGVNDHDVDLFEGQYVVPNGMSYNSYIVMDEKIAVFDTVDASFKDEWLANIKRELKERVPSYLIVQHMEPDHSANILHFMTAYPQTTVVASQKAFVMMKNFFGTDFPDGRVVVGDGDTLCTGKHTFKFVTAPMVHWPEVIMTYDMTSQVLFSADAFGKFGALDVEDEDWACEARRYYFGIVGKFGASVQALFRKIGGIGIKTICPLHGPVLSENLAYYLGLYDTWSKYEAEDSGVFIAYTSVYGHTKGAVEILADKLREKGIKTVVADLARSDMAECLEDAFRYDRLVLATTTYNGGVFPQMREFINTLVEHNYQNRRVAFVENGSWTPVANKVMKGMLAGCKGLEMLDSEVRIMSAVDENCLLQIDTLVEELSK